MNFQYVSGQQHLKFKNFFLMIYHADKIDKMSLENNFWLLNILKSLCLKYSLLMRIELAESEFHKSIGKNFQCQI